MKIDDIACRCDLISDTRSVVQVESLRDLFLWLQPISPSSELLRQEQCFWLFLYLFKEWVGAAFNVSECLQSLNFCMMTISYLHILWRLHLLRFLLWFVVNRGCYFSGCLWNWASLLICFYLMDPHPLNWFILLYCHGRSIVLDRFYHHGRLTFFLLFL
jgi:hypothetical protein